MQEHMVLSSMKKKKIIEGSFITKEGLKNIYDVSIFHEYELISDLIIEDSKEGYEKLTQLDFKSVYFNECTFINCNFENSCFTDCVFENCNFSSSSFKGAFFNKVNVLDCKFVGAFFENVSIQNMVCKKSIFRLANFSDARFENVLFSECDCVESYFDKSQLINFQNTKVDFTHAEFFKTKLKGIDFSESTTDNIIVSDTMLEIKGAIFNVYQAADFAKKFGIIIK